ncbi:LysR family transcriptional regulator [Bacillus solimangrovi]|uniref:Transcriptional regulator n=1 Tax=Bacillus solimangrovi TaxID=1305675 RepID=A0A1E5LE49_9BACI|nr:LysR family transcriptional regulator [Bacillus solimangrovi]OEH92358.1 transcriptional regulator [Bacillus solimangrovi]
MDSHDLVIFKHAAELKSISKAADRLGYVQPNVSQKIKNLEVELGVKLFTRNNRGVTLTAQGELLLDYANQIIHLIDEAKSTINPTKWRESLTIGATQTISAVKVPQLFSSFMRLNDNVNLKIKTSTRQNLLDMLSNGEIDGLFLNESNIHSQFEVVYSYIEKVVLISPFQIETGKKQNQTLIVNTDPNCIYRDQTLTYFNQSAAEQFNIMEFDSLEAILHAVNNGLGASILPKDLINNNREVDTLYYHELSERVQIDFIIKNRKEKSKSLRNFIHHLHNS